MTPCQGFHAAPLVQARRCPDTLVFAPSTSVPSPHLFDAAMKRHLSLSLLFLSALLASAKEQFFFARQTHPLSISPDGSKLLALNSEQGRLSIFATGAAPVLIREIPVGLLPVSVRLRTPDEAWVVNELSDSISIVSLSKGAVIATIATGDEPGDIAFASGKAFVTCARDNRLDVFDPLSREKITEIPLKGLFPRSLVVSPDGSKIHVSFLFTSNGTTILPRAVAPPQDVPAWADPDLPPPPQTARIVSVDDPEISYGVVDHDIATIATDDFSAITYLGNVGTNIFNLEVLADGRLLAPNSEARNLIFFERQLRGRFARTRLAILGGIEERQIDLNRDPDFIFPEVDESGATTALAQVKATLPDPDGRHLWLAAFGSDRLAKLRLSDQTIIQRIDLRQDDEAMTRIPSTMRGPRGLALHPTLPHLYVLNRLSNTLATIDRNSFSIVAETPLGTIANLAPDLKLGRGFLFDARLSGNGTVSCASCHIDLERDGMAWDLGDPNGELFSVPGAFLSLHAPDIFEDREMHPMKGPMMTQTLIGLVEQSKLHWRGDKASIQSFNSTFPNLLAAKLREDSEMALIAAYLNTLRHHPNPYLKLDRNFPDEVNGGNPTDGIAIYTLFDNHCSACHTFPTGSSNNIDIPATVGSFQPLKDTPFRTTYQRIHFDPNPGGRSLSGYGMGSDGSLHDFPIGHPYTLHILDDINRPLAVRQKEKRDLTAFILAFDSGTAPAIGHSITFIPSQADDTERLARLDILEAQSSLGQFSEVGVVAHGLLAGQPRSFHFNPLLGKYAPDLSGQRPLAAQDLLGSLAPNDVMTFTGVPKAQVTLLSTDRNGDGIPDRSEPAPLPEILPNGALIWPRSALNWFPEFSDDFTHWQALTTPREQEEAHFKQLPPGGNAKGFFRLRSIR